MTTPKKFLFVLAALFIMGGFFVVHPGITSASTTILSDGFGTGSTSTTVSGWSEGGNAGDDAEVRAASSGNDSASPDGGRFAVMLGSSGYICRTITTTGYSNVKLSYYWRGDSDSGSASDNALVEFKAASGHICSETTGWTQLANHDMRNDASWTTQSAITNAGMNNTTFLVKFRDETSGPTSDVEHFRVDGVLITGDAIVTTGTIHVTKVTIPANDTTAFSITATGSGTITAPATRTTLATNHAEDFTVTPGTYSISETADANWVEDVSACQNISVTAGNTTNCIITNTKKGTIKITKVSTGGTGTFNFSTTGTGLSNFQIDTSPEGGPDKIFSNILPGTYSVTEGTLPTGWDFTSLSCAETGTENTTTNQDTKTASITLDAGETITCTYTNTKRGSITVKKQVVAPNGTTPVSDNTVFTAHLNGGPSSTFRENYDVTYANLVPGTSYAVTEDQNDNYGTIGYSADCNIESLSPGQDAVCTITNPQKKGHLLVKKIVTNPNGGTGTAGQFSFTVNNAGSYYFDQNGDNPLLGEKDLTLDPGTYSIAEILNPEAPPYAISSSNCTNVVITSGGVVNESTTCTITNSDIPAGQGAITIIKNLPNDNGGNFTLNNFPLKVTSVPDPESDNSPVTTSMTSELSKFFTPGNYVVSEDNPGNLTGFDQSISCTDGQTSNTDGNISVANQEAWVCTITNDDQPGHVIIVKNTGNENYNDTFTFTVTGKDPVILTTTGGTKTSDPITINANTNYTVDEPSVPSGWSFNSVICKYDGENAGIDGPAPTSHVINVDSGETATCTYTNTRQTGSLKVIKVVQGGGETVTSASFQIHVMQNGTDVATSPQAGNASGTTYSGLPTGNYTISETGGPVGFTTAFSDACNADGVITVTTNNETPATCTITNTAIPTHTLTYAAGTNGSITGTTPQTVNNGASGTAVTAVANGGFHFVNWSDESTANPRTDANVTADISVTANFAANPAPAPTPVSSGGGGSVAQVFTPGDINQDGHVDEFDFAILLSDWGKTGIFMSDINHDGIVNLADLAILMFNWRK